MATTIKSRPTSKSPKFVEATPNKKKKVNTVKLQKAAPSSKVKKRKNGDEIWDELLATPESDAFLKALSEQAHQDYLSGNTEPGGFGDDD